MTQSQEKRVFLIYVSDGRLWRQRVRGVLTWCDERAWYDMGAYVAGRRETCSWRVCDGCRREYAAGARSQVNMSRWVRQGIKGAQGVIKRGIWAVRLCAGGLNVMLRRRTYLMARATTSVEQELSWAAWCEIEVIRTLRGSFETCLRCWIAYLAWRELPAFADQHGLEGQLGKVSRWSQRSNTARRNIISSSNQLRKHEWRLQVKIPSRFCSWSEIRSWSNFSDSTCK